MPWLPCLTCGALSSQSRCPAHRGRKARGYGNSHVQARKTLLATNPRCAVCGHWACEDAACEKCPLEADHTPSLDYVRKHPGTKVTYRLLCAECNRRKSNGQSRP